MKDFLLNVKENTFNKTNNKLLLSRNNLEYLQQKLRTVLSFQKGEWFTDKEIGIPYIPDFDISKTDHRTLLTACIQEAIMEVDGIKELLEFETDYNSNLRKLFVDFTVKTNENEIIEYSKEITE